MASSKRERELARMRAERQAARRAAAAARKRRRQQNIAIGVAVLAILGVVGATVLLTGDDDKDTLQTSAPPSATPASTATGSPSGTGTCSYDKAAAAVKKVSGTPPTQKVETVKPAVVDLSTTQGDITLTLDSAKAPCTVNSFTFLAKQKYFDDTSCHRLTTSGIFVLQCGDPSGLGSGGPGYQFADENLEGATYPRGTVAMANAGPGTNGSQFFLVYKDTQLPPSYTPFGTITKGLDVVEKIAKGGSNPEGDGKPKISVTITKAAVKA